MQWIQSPTAQQYAYLPPSDEAGQAGRAALRTSVRGPMLVGMLIVTLLVAGAGFWAATAPLAGGAVAPGVISPDGSRRTVQHLEGGIVGEILVRDGDFVEVGAPVVTLKDTQARAIYEMLLSQFWGLRAAQARLIAEQLGRAAVEFPAELLAAGQNVEVRDILDVQRQLFTTRREALESRKRVLRQRIAQIHQQIRGMQAQVASAQRRHEIVKEELKAKVALLELGFIPKPQVLALRREEAKILGDGGEYGAAVARGDQQIGEAELELVALDAQRADENAGDLERVRGELAKVREQLRAGEDTLERTVIRAPVSGTVVDLRFKTLGGVIQPGTPILDIVPANDELLIDARVAPIDIDVVHLGLPAQVHLLAYSYRRLPRIVGKVLSVSADSLRDDRTGAAYYLARVEVDRRELASLANDVQLVPGMPAEVLIVTGERTLFEYLFQPFGDFLRRGLRET